MFGIRLEQHEAGARNAAMAAFLFLALSATAGAQDSVAMVDGQSMVKSVASIASAAEPNNSTTISTTIARSPSSVASSGQVVNDAVAQPLPSTANQRKNQIIGMEPGTLALIGFGLLALILARRNAR